MFDLEHDTLLYGNGIVTQTRYFPGKWKWLRRPKSSAGTKWRPLVYWQGGHLEKRQTWTDAHNVKHIVRWEVRRDASIS